MVVGPGQAALVRHAVQGFSTGTTPAGGFCGGERRKAGQKAVLGDDVGR